MKKFNLNILTPLLFTLLLQGCMPDSLTKFKKDTPKKTTVSATTSPPVVDSSGNVVPFTPPTYMRYGATVNSRFNVNVETIPLIITPIALNIDGSVGESGSAVNYIVSCVLDTSGDSQTQSLPAGLSVNNTNCKIEGKPTAIKSIVTPFCSDRTSGDQTTCESTHLVWTGTCSNKDFEYSNQAACEAAYNTWYAVGSQIPYRIKLTYKNSSGTLFNAYATAHIGSYSKIDTLIYNQSDKLALRVSTNASVYTDMVPLRTTTATTAYASANILTSINGVSGAVNFIDTSLNIIGFKKFIKMTLTNATGFSTGGFITNSSNTKIGKIFKKDPNNTNIVYVENISDGEIYFDVNDTIRNNFPYASGSNTTLIAAIDETQGINLVSSTDFDNDAEYYGSKIKLTAFANSYLANSATAIKPLKPISLVPANNGIVFSVSPKLPDGLSINTATGAITGKFLKALPSVVAYTITATNPLGSTSFVIVFTAPDAPADLSLSTKQIITVSTTAFFTEGETLFQAITPPATEAPQGKILKILNGYQMAVDTSNGAFLAGASLDSGSGFFSEKGFVVPDKSCVNTIYTNQTDCEANSYTWSEKPIYYNLALKLDTTTTYYTLGTCSDLTYTTQSTCEDALKVWGPTYVSNASGAKGVIAGFYDGFDCSDSNYSNQTDCTGAGKTWASHTFLLARHLTKNPANITNAPLGEATSVSNAKTFNQGDVLVGSTRTISEIDYNYIKMDLASAASFKLGGDVTTRASAAPNRVQAGGYTYKTSGNTIYVSDISHSPAASLFKKTDVIYAGENASGLNSTISNVTHDVLIVAERGQKVVFSASTSSGAATFSISPTLPAGLSLNTRTGQISGTPTTITPRKEFTLTATNFVGQTTYVFAMEIRDYFSISDKSGAPSFLLHKIGDTQIDRKCRVNANDIINNPSGSAFDVRCHLEAEEEDLNFNPIKFQASAGPGVCQYIQYAPYYFWQYSPIQTDATVTLGTYRTGCATDTAPTADLCIGNYSAYGAKGPNCDESKIKYLSQPTVDNGAGVCIASGAPTVNYVTCGGKKVSCISGPVKDLMNDTELANGFTSKIYQSPNGLTQSWQLSSPITKGDFGNQRVANSTMNNQCTTSNTDVNTWKSKTAAMASTLNPFGKANPYYTFYCLNAASQITARVRVIVRDWDRNFKINYGIDLDNPSTTVSGVASDADGAFMNNTGADIYGYPYNNHPDWDNDYKGKGSCSLPAYTSEYGCTANSGTWTSKAANYGTSCGVLGAGAGIYDYEFPEDSL